LIIKVGKISSRVDSVTVITPDRGL